MTIINFRAGRVIYDESTKIATPDAIQGEITIKPSEEEESFYSFEWKSKETTNADIAEELLVIPGDVQWKHIKEAETGRVFELSFLSSSARHLFWLQDINDNDDDPSELSAKDKKILEKILKVFEPVEEEEEEEEEEEQKQQQEDNTEEQSVEQEDVEIKDAVESASQPEQSNTDFVHYSPIYDLNDLFTSDSLNNLISNATEDQLSKLYSFLPTSTPHTKESLRSVLFSNFFRGSASNLSNALNNGGGFVVSKSLDLQYQGEGIENYLKSLRKQQKDDEKKNG
ncbi:hypothetical protein WICMUC_001887 [Wickerhamomyces mucosus]|uniref:Pru domain-containing protein n=1 Tax=Wickerhamomyces mucosus TaxID=1378264 RepID=A0A9P8PRS6_9ASCO|nr:hypothetical protein WICMUC_001887 [Wickerhamomyces mucosus]